MPYDSGRPKYRVGAVKLLCGGLTASGTFDRLIASHCMHCVPTTCAIEVNKRWKMFLCSFDVMQQDCQVVGEWVSEWRVGGWVWMGDDGDNG